VGGREFRAGQLERDRERDRERRERERERGREEIGRAVQFDKQCASASEGFVGRIIDIKKKKKKERN
jgi:hypothetical protein